MRRLPARNFLYAFAALAVGLLAFTSSANARPFSTGILDIDAFAQESDIPFERTEAAGAKYIKRNLYWTLVAPDSDASAPPEDFDPTDPGDPNYNWAAIDEFVRHTTEFGMVPILTVTNTPKWARWLCDDASECTPLPWRYAEFAEALASRYDGTFDPGDGEGTLPRVRHFQAWVEPNLNFFYKPVFRGKRPIAPITYRRILNAFYDAIHDVRRDNLVISAGLAPLARPGATLAPLDFMRRLLCMRGRQNPRPIRNCNATTKLDIWSTHPYTTGGPTHSAPGPDDVAMGDLPEMTRLLQAANRAGKIASVVHPRRTPFWVTEFSYDSKPPDPGGLNPRIHVQWSSEAMYRMYEAGVDVMVWFGYRDEARNGRPFCETFDSGLFLRGPSLAQDRAKPIYRAFRFPFFASRIRNGLHVWGRTPDSRPGPVLIDMSGRGGLRPVKRVRAGAGGVFEARFRARGVQGNSLVRARAPRNGGNSIPFKLRYPRDFYQPPFGRCLGGGGGRPNSN